MTCPKDLHLGAGASSNPVVKFEYWEITKNIFNSFDADIFISTWDTNDRQDNYPYKFHGNKNMNMDIINSLDNLKEAEQIQITELQGIDILRSLNSHKSSPQRVPIMDQENNKNRKLINFGFYLSKFNFKNP